jgi:hypothetical protein
MSRTFRAHGALRKVKEISTWLANLVVEKKCRMVRMGKVGMRCKCGKKLAKTGRCK